jgi:hypothetical protein
MAPTGRAGIRAGRRGLSHVGRPRRWCRSDRDSFDDVPRDLSPVNPCSSWFECQRDIERPPAARPAPTSRSPSPPGSNAARSAPKAPPPSAAASSSGRCRYEGSKRWHVVPAGERRRFFHIGVRGQERASRGAPAASVTARSARWRGTAVGATGRLRPLPRLCSLPGRILDRAFIPGMEATPWNGSLSKSKCSPLCGA